MSTTPDPTAVAIAALTTEVQALRSAIDIQFKRMAAMQAEIDLLPEARRRRREAMSPPTQTPKAGHNGNGPLTTSGWTAARPRG